MTRRSGQLLASLIAFAAIAVSAPSIAVASTTDGLVGYWPLNEGAGSYLHDVSGYGNDGQLSGAAAWAATPFGTGLSFGPGTGQVNVVDAPSLEPASAVTVSAWVENLGSPGLYRYIVAKGATGCIAASYGLYTGPDGGLQFYVSRQQGTTYTRSSNAGTQMWDGRWHLAVGTFDGSVLRLYVDGTEVGSAVSYPGPLVYRLLDSNNLYIGNYPGCTEHGFVGSIDDVRIWDRALSAQEVGGLMPTPGQSLPPVPPQTPLPAPAPQSSPIGSVHVSSAAQAAGQERNRHVGRRELVITYTDSKGGRTTLTLYRLVTVGGCTGPASGRSRESRRCTRSRLLGRFTHRDRHGRNSFQLWASRHRALEPGRYRLVITLHAGSADAMSKTVRFRIRPGELTIRVQHSRRRHVRHSRTHTRHLGPGRATG